MKMTPHVYVCKHILTSILFLLSTHVVCFSMVLFLIIYLKTQELFFQLEIPFHLNAILVLCFGLCLIFNLLLCKIIIQQGTHAFIQDHLELYTQFVGRCWIIKEFGVILDIKHVSMFLKHKDLSDFFPVFFSLLLNINLLSTPHSIDHNLSTFCNV